MDFLSLLHNFGLGRDSIKTNFQKSQTDPLENQPKKMEEAKKKHEKLLSEKIEKREKLMISFVDSHIKTISLVVENFTRPQSQKPECVVFSSCSDGIVREGARVYRDNREFELCYTNGTVGFRSLGRTDRDKKPIPRKFVEMAKEQSIAHDMERVPTEMLLQASVIYVFFESSGSSSVQKWAVLLRNEEDPHIAAAWGAYQAAGFTKNFEIAWCSFRKAEKLKKYADELLEYL